MVFRQGRRTERDVWVCSHARTADLRNDAFRRSILVTTSIASDENSWSDRLCPTSLIQRSVKA